MQLSDYLRIEWENWYLKIKVVPNSKETSLFDYMADGMIKIRVKSIPEKGRANKELINFISKELHVEKSQVEILSWTGNRVKMIKVAFSN